MQKIQAFLPNLSVHRMGNAIYLPRVLLPALCPGDIPPANVSPEESFQKTQISLTLTAPNMKLHLPKQLFTALLAAITLAAPAALTLGSAAWGASEEADPLADETTTNTTTAWDANWGELEGAPVLSDAHICTDVTSNRTVVDGSFYMIDESFESGEKVVVDLQDSTNSNMNVVGGFATQTGSNDQGDVNREVWIKATSGNYNFLIGGNYANNWSSGNAANFTGDTHILVDGAEVTIGSVVGANHFDSKSPTFTGDTYISVMNGTIAGDIIGSGTATHNVGTNQQTGHTHVFVYNEQTSSGYVTGGGLSGGFDGQNRNQKLTLNGDTHVTVDLSAQSGALIFAKHIVGAHAYKNTSTPILSHTGTTNITLIGNSDSDTKFTGQVIGGNYSGAGGTLTVGSVNMSIGAYVEGTIVGGNYALSSNVETVAENITITVGTNGHAHQDLYGGHYVGGTGTAGLSGSLGDVSITLNGGTIGNTYGGSWIQRNNASASVSQGNIHIDLSSGNLLGDIYAAGHQEGSSKMTTASTKVSVDSAVTITSGKTISGGYKYASEKSGSTVTGAKTLVFNGASQDRSSITFDSFDTFQVTNADAEVTLGTLTNVTNLTKTGSGKLTLSGALGAESARLGTVSATAGELALSGTGYVTTLEISGDADVRVASGGNLDVTTFNASTGGARTDRNVYIENGATVTAATFNVNWNMGSVAVNGALNVTTELYLGTNNDDNITGLFSGTGVITASKLRAGNWGSYGINVATLKIGADGLVVENGAVLNLASATTTVAGTTTVNSGNVLNFKAGSATLSGSVTNNGSINVNGGSLTLENGISGSGTVLLDGGQLTVSGGTATFANTLSMGTGAALTVSGGTANVNGSFNVTGTNVAVRQSGAGVLNLGGGITINEGAAATFNGQVGIGSTITNNGTLTLNDSITIIGELSAFTQRGEATESYQLADGTSSGNNGFHVVSGASYWLTSEGSTGTTNVAAGITAVQHGGNSYKLNQDDGGEGEGTSNNWYFQVESNVGKVYYITTGDVDVDKAVQAAATGYSLQGGKMQLTQGQVSSSAMSYTSGTITLSDGAVLVLDSESGSLTAQNLLTGILSASPSSEGGTPTGKLQIKQNVSLENNTTATYTGVVELVNATLTAGSGPGNRVNISAISEFILNGTSEIYYHANPTADTDTDTDTDIKKITVESGTGSLYLRDSDDAPMTVGSVDIAAGATFKFWSNWHDSALTVESLTGQGTFRAESSDVDAHNPNVTVSSLKGFEGNLDFVKDSSISLNVVVSTGTDAAVSFNSLTTTNSNGEMDFDFNVETDTTVGTVSLSGSNNSINLSEGKSLSVGTGTVTNGSLSAGSAVVASKSAETPASLSHVKMTGSGFSKAASAGSDKGSISNANVEIAQLAEDASFTIQDMTLTNTTITATTPTTQVKLQNVTASNVVLAQGKFTMGETAQVGMSGAGSYDFTTSSLSGITLQNSVADGVSSSTLVVDLGDLSCVTAMGPGKYDLSITLSGFTMQDYTQGIVFAADSWLGQLLTAQGATAYVSGTVETPASVSEGGSTGGVSVSYSAATGGNVGTVITISGLNVPEPATSTLSLLALAALAARRRRK